MMGSLTFIDALQLAVSTGVLSGGLGVLRWSLTMEKRVQRLELIEEFKTVKQ